MLRKTVTYINNFYLEVNKQDSMCLATNYKMSTTCFLVNGRTLLYLCEWLNNHCGEFEGNSASLHVLDISEFKLIQQTLQTPKDVTSLMLYQPKR